MRASWSDRRGSFVAAHPKAPRPALHAALFRRRLWTWDDAGYVRIFVAGKSSIPSLGPALGPALGLFFLLLLLGALPLVFRKSGPLLAHLHLCAK